MFSFSKSSGKQTAYSKIIFNEPLWEKFFNYSDSLNLQNHECIIIFGLVDIFSEDLDTSNQKLFNQSQNSVLVRPSHSINRFQQWLTANQIDCINQDLVKLIKNLIVHFNLEEYRELKLIKQTLIKIGVYNRSGAYKVPISEIYLVVAYLTCCYQGDISYRPERYNLQSNFFNNLQKLACNCGLENYTKPGRAKYYTTKLLSHCW